MGDYEILRNLAGQYAEWAASDANRAVPDRYRRLNSLKGGVRPPVLVFEVPWSEFSGDGELALCCAQDKNRALEGKLRRALYQMKHFRGDYALRPYAEAPVVIDSSGFGFTVSEERIESSTGSDISAHAYFDQMPDEKALEKFHMPVIELNREATDANVDLMGRVFSGLLPVRKTGVELYMPSWDVIPRLHGVENCLYDLYDRPEFMHAVIEKFTQLHEYELTRYGDGVNSDDL